MRLTAKSLKATVVLNVAELAATPVPNEARTILKITIDGTPRVITADVATKSVKRAIAAIAEAGGPEHVAIVLQGKLVGDTLSEAGLSSMPKTPKSVAA
jgi:hypothetical protein